MGTGHRYYESDQFYSTQYLTPSARFVAGRDDLGAKNVVCGEFDSGHFNGISIHVVDSFDRPAI